MQIHTVRAFLLTALATTTLAGALAAQEPRQRASPHEKTDAVVDGATISVEYGRPYMKGRKIYGGLVPFGQVWRTGADEATTLVTNRTLLIGSTEVPAGTYTLYTIPGEKEWTLAINKQTGQWGTQYAQDQDLARVPMTRGPLTPPLEQLTIRVLDTPAGGTLKIDWADTTASVDFRVK